MLQPGDCSPSRSVVSKILICLIILPQSLPYAVPTGRSALCLQNRSLVRGGDQLRVPGQIAGLDLRLRADPRGACARCQLLRRAPSAQWCNSGISMEMRSPSSTSAMGPPAAASGLTWPMDAPRVAPEKRPSVMQGHALAQAHAADGGGGVEHLPHAGAALGPLVADDHHVAGHDLAVRRWRRWRPPRCRTPGQGPRGPSSPAPRRTASPRSRRGPGCP